MRDIFAPGEDRLGSVRPGSPHRARGPSMFSDPAYPRPLLQRTSWKSLNGIWDFALDEREEFDSPHEVQWSRSIVAPYAPETPASGINYLGLCRRFWYRTRFNAEPLKSGHLFLRFEAVDYHATVWINGNCAGTHTGGYTPFSFSIGPHLLE